MTSEKAPERIWIDNERYEQRWHVLADGCQPPVDYPHVFGQYTRTDLVAAKDARIAELEAKVDHLRGVLGQIDQGCNHYHMTATYSESVLRNALRTARDHARAALSREGEA